MNNLDESGTFFAMFDPIIVRNFIKVSDISFESTIVSFIFFIDVGIKLFSDF